jgi:hypothetical protein
VEGEEKVPHGHTAHVHTRGVPAVISVIGFPDVGLPASSAFPIWASDKGENRRFQTIFTLSAEKKSPPLVGFPDPTPLNPSVLRPSSALLIGIRSAGIPHSETSHSTPPTPTHLRHCHQEYRRRRARAQQQELPRQAKHVRVGRLVEPHESEARVRVGREADPH